MTFLPKTLTNESFFEFGGRNCSHTPALDRDIESEKGQIARIVVLPELIKSFFTHNLDPFHQGRSNYYYSHTPEHRKGERE